VPGSIKTVIYHKSVTVKKVIPTLTTTTTTTTTTNSDLYFKSVKLEPSNVIGQAPRADWSMARPRSRRAARLVGSAFQNGGGAPPSSSLHWVFAWPGGQDRTRCETEEQWSWSLVTGWLVAGAAVRS
jgi:hypothetical protein